MSAESSKQKRKADAAKGLARLELYGVHPDDREPIKQKAAELKLKRAKSKKAGKK